jgi:hypothetical protein
VDDEAVTMLVMPYAGYGAVQLSLVTTRVAVDIVLTADEAAGLGEELLAVAGSAVSSTGSG